MRTVILSEAKDLLLVRWQQILRFAQDDKSADGCSLSAGRLWAGLVGRRRGGDSAQDRRM